MKIEFLTAKEVSIALRGLIAEHDEFHWAVAWGSMTDVAKDFLKHSAKFRDVTFGVAFCQTDPDLIEALVGMPNTQVACRFPKGTYHPKVYCFRSGDEAAAIVGSANFTFGGLERNLEAAIAVTGRADEPLFQDLFAFTRSCRKYGDPVTADFATAYRASWRRAARMPKPPSNPLEGLDRIRPAAFSSPLISMSWNDYVAEVRASAHHDIGGSLALLRIAQEWFASVASFADLPPAQRKAIAGIIGVNQKTDSSLKRDWGWFGSMQGMGDFANRIDRNDQHLAHALDSIPRKGVVTKGHYEKFVGLFREAFANSSRTGGVPTASRLLAMKRPDTFICLCKPNILQASQRMSFPRTTLTLDNYWENVIEVIRLSNWYDADKPDGADGEIWENRTAMLDAILYKPD
ncbi:phospholipase D family protein [Sphingobium olei]|uniref:Phospholipase D family protein n=1 Tax=Sphingobium olei TaxID=420955 RepID=A0ABW3NXG7_9SPHN